MRCNLHQQYQTSNEDNIDYIYIIRTKKTHFFNNLEKQLSNDKIDFLD